MSGDADRPSPDRRSPDRVGLESWTAVGLSLSTAAMAGVAGRVFLAHQDGDLRIGMLGGAAAALLMLWGLPSLSLRRIARFVAVTTFMVVGTFATLSTGTPDGLESVLMWVTACVATLVLVDRVALDQVPELAPVNRTPPVIGTDRSSAVRHRRIRRSLLGIVVFSAVAMLATVVVAPTMSERLAPRVSPGSGAWDRSPLNPSPTASLTSSDSMDMSVNPELSDEILMTVTAPHRTFLRGDVYDVYDGQRWYRADRARSAVGADGTVTVDSTDLGALGPHTFEQRIRIEASAADIYFAAPVAVQIEATAQIAQTSDGTLAPWSQVLGRGTTYTVTSRSHHPTADRLRGLDGPIPEAILARYAQPPVATDRVRDLAAEIVESSGADNPYDQVRALEAWMGENLEYSLTAPPSPAGVDVVDHFLFRSKLGWCQQIASSLVVMARSLGIPARVATGFVASERDRASGSFIVRGKHAHAWAEVWFPEVGWVAFDPTADVPTAPDGDEARTWADSVGDVLPELAIAAVVLFVVIRLGRWAWRVAAARRARRPRTDLARLDRDLESLGIRWGIQRPPGQTATEHAQMIDTASGGEGRSSVLMAGQVIDDHLYSPQGTAPERVRTAAEALAEATRVAPAKRRWWNRKRG